MILVPRQLRRSGMTGDVPYYGGRFTPAQAYAASHPPRPAPAPVSAVTETTPVVTDPAETIRTLQELLDSGVITAEEHRELLGRVSS